MPAALSNTKLFKEIKVGNVVLKNRLVFAPSTRIRCVDDNVATDSMLEYYSQRAKDNGGLIIVETTFTGKVAATIPGIPVLETEEQVQGWKKIVEAIHENGSKVCLQITELGRSALPQVLKAQNIPFVAPSAIYFNEESRKVAEGCGNPLRALTVDEIHDATKRFVDAAKKAIEIAKFDIVEIHAANMGLMNQFLQEESNQRTDEYGGSIENRSRFVLETLDSIAKEVGFERVAVRISPYSRFMGGQSIDTKTNPVVNYGYLLSELERRAKGGKKIAYVSFIEPRISADSASKELLTPDSSWVNEIWKGVIIRAGNLLHDENYTELKNFVDGDDRTLIGASRFYTSNPDLVNRLKNGYPLTPYDRSTFYSGPSNWGYITWPVYGEKSIAQDSEISNATPKALV
ncbi:hypothetical protein FOA43_004285 [Brettanomyces nanus]|uniref:NADH:flavin oxidoreductase/NADH oxidase N-terminal domain-containing protein n=1 Tax=Eeniella nana TaxID=13502 RepID=A0A875S5I6_EENNA|nr:uncharacterized protein FOA43_004285 [Brettanomyces nanus]QPG76891.1 hypothetical protein FOA43_004285 [Brettanomyces nanus]